MAIGNVELMYECFPKHSRIETARIYEIRHKKTEEERREDENKYSGHE